MTESGVRALALFVAVFVYAIVAIFSPVERLPEVLPGLSVLTYRLIEVCATALSLAALYVASEWILFHLWGYSIVGRWLYRSDSGNFGLATITIERSVFVYRVELYRTAREAWGGYKKNYTSRCFGHAYSRMTKFAKGEFLTDYHIEYPNPELGYKARKGLLTLIPTNNPKVMTGHWHSTVESDEWDELRAGRLDFLRPEVFRQAYIEGDGLRE